MTRRQGPVTISVSSSSDRSSLRALFAPRFDELPGVAHKVFATEDTSAESHWAEVEWDFPLDARGVTVLWPDGKAPREFVAKVRVEDVWIDLGEPAHTIDGRWTWLSDVVCDGMRFEQSAAGGHDDFEGVMRIRGAALLASEPGPLVRLGLADESLVSLEMPILTCWTGMAVVDVSDAHELRVEHAGDSVAEVVVTIQRIGDSGHPDDLHAWVDSIQFVRILSGESWAEHPAKASVDRSDAGVLCGHVSMRIRLDEPARCDELAIDLPARGGSILGLTGIVLEERPSTVDLSSSEPKEGTESGAETVSAACFALPLGRDGDGARFGVTAAGVIEVKHSLPWPSRGRALLIRLHGDELEPVRFAGEAGVVLMEGLKAFSIEPRVDAGRQVLRISVPEFDSGFSFSMVAADGLNPLRCTWEETESGVSCDGRPLLASKSRVRARLVGDELNVQIEGAWVDVLGEAAAPESERAEAAGGRPAGLDPRVSGLLSELGRFRGPDGRLCYGRYPSPYHGMIFGLEEDYGFFGAMLWGADRFAIEAFDATYLEPSHLDPTHYLHDLRHCLLPWQMWRLCRLAGQDVTTLFGERGRSALSACAAWIRTERRKTADAVGAADDAGVRVFAGLLPPGRFGGDLDFRTQSLYLSAAAAVSLGALAELETDADAKATLAEESGEMSAAVVAAFDSVADSGFVPLDTGGGEAGPYYQLAAGGVLHPVNFFADNDPIAAQIDQFMEDDNRLHAGLPRFDAWGTEGPGDDAHYGLGYLLRCLRRGHGNRFRVGLHSLLSAGEEDRLSYREVRPLGPQWGARAHLPERALSRSEPCIGPFGAALVLLRHAWVSERFGTGWSPSGELLLLGGLGDEFWASDPMFSTTFPTLLGPLGMTAFPGDAGWTLRLLLPPGCAAEVAAPPADSPIRRVVTASGEISAVEAQEAGFVRLPEGAAWVRFERGKG